MKSTIAGGLGIAVLALSSTVALADGHGTSDSFGTLTGNVGVASEYVFRGLPSSNNSAQVWGSVDWNRKNTYLGVWMSNTNDNDLGNEVDVYGGLTLGDFDLGAVAYFYPADQDQDGAGPDGGYRNSKILEVYTGYNHGPFSAYAYYSLGAYGRSDDDSIYLDLNWAMPAGEKAELAFHAGYTIYHGDDYNKGAQRSTDQQVDLGLTLSIGGLWFGMTSILDNDDNDGRYKRPRINVGYTWTFEDFMPVRVNF